MGREQVAEEPRYRVVIDCDPGVDDALALLAALAVPMFQLDFVTTVAGNAMVRRTTGNARRVVRLSGRQGVQVFRGASAPLNGPFVTTDDHSISSLPFDDAEIISGDPMAVLQETLLEWLRQPSDLPKRLIATGPLTNIATVLQQDPSALSSLDALYVMGGSLSRRGGRFSPEAETNFFLDPEAAAIVMRSGAPIRLFDYDATRLCAVSVNEWTRIVSDTPPALRERVGAWLKALRTAQVVRQGHATWAIHDLCAVAGAAGIEPGRWETVCIQVETAGASRGAVIAGPAGDADPYAVQVARDLEVEATLEFLTQWLWRLPAARLSG